MKILNLDKLSTKGTRNLRINGVDYEVLPMSVGNFIDTTEAAERMVEAGNTNLGDEMKETVALIRRSVPTVPEAELLALEIPQIQMIVKFIKGDDVSNDSEGADGKK